ncbi:MAG: cytochrome C [Arcobacter sp.]|nr:cytochrome C [Arcobacter sp.]
MALIFIFYRTYFSDKEAIHSSEIMYSSLVKDLFTTSDTSSSKGRLLPTSKVKILNKTKGLVKIQIEGYRKANIPYAIYFVKGNRILLAGLRKDAKFKFKILETSEDEDGVKWEKVSFEAFTKDKNLTKDLDFLYAKAKSIYYENCSMCHSANRIDQFSPNQWPSIIKSMITRTSMTKEEKYLVTQYLQKHARDIKKGE